MNPGPTIENVLDIFHMNIISINHQSGHLNFLVHDFDSLCFTETHLDNSVSNDGLLIDDFNDIIRKYRNCFVGGVMIGKDNDQ